MNKKFSEFFDLKILIILNILFIINFLKTDFHYYIL